MVQRLLAPRGLLRRKGHRLPFPAWPAWPPGPGRPGGADYRRGGVVRQAWGMTQTLTLMAVHAHPDDEASSTGGVLATYSDQGVRTVVVTCTNGEFGVAPGGVQPGQDGHDEHEAAHLPL